MKRRFFEPRAPRAINFGWDHGRYADYWSAIHLLTGLLLGGIWMLAGLSLSTALVISVLLASLYEGLEVALGVSEDVQNVLTDIVLVAIGAPLAFFLFPVFGFAGTNLVLALCVVVAIDLFLLRKGWNGYLKNALKKNRKRS